MKPRGPTVAARGASMVEMLITVAVFSLLVSAAVATVAGMRGASAGSETLARLQADAKDALDSVSRDLRVSGLVTVAGTAFPGFFVDGNALAPFTLHAHPGIVQSAVAGDPDFGPSREIVFALPADANGDRVPDIDVDGALTWDARQFSYVHVTGADGHLYLERRVDGANPTTVARDVERVVFDDLASSMGEVPFGAIRVRVWLRAVRSGHVYRQFVEATVRLRNS